MSGPGRSVNRLVNLLVSEHGCSARRTGSGHWLVSRPGRPPVTLSGTPSDRRALKNMISDCRRVLGISL